MDDSPGVDKRQDEHPGSDVYYYVRGRRMELYRDPEVFAVRLEQVARVRPGVLSTEAGQMLEKARPVTFLPRDGLNVYRADNAAACIDMLRKETGVAHATSVYRRIPQSPHIVIVTPRLLAQFKQDLGVDRMASTLERMALRVLEPLAYASPNGFLLEADPGIDGLGALKAANAMVEEGLVEFAEPDLVEPRNWHGAAMPDPLSAGYLHQQWHLSAVGAPEAWKKTRGSATICIAVLDDGVDVGHPEFAGPLLSELPKVAAQFDFATGTADASPKTYIDNHGTATAGIAAAVGMQAAGIAPECRLVLARIPDYLGVADEARMFQWAADAGADVINCPWGPPDGSGPVPLPTPTQMAIRYCLINGRAGKGIPIFWAAGNDAGPVSGNGYAANPDVMAIAACTAADRVAPYSSHGPEIFACAPSNGGPRDPAIFTTDRRGRDGYNPGSAIRGDTQGDYTNSFGGTSAAASMAAGIAALALSANPALTVAQIRELLRDTADRIGDRTGSDELSYDSEGHNDYLGYGRLNAFRVAQEACRNSIRTDVPIILGPASWSRVDSPPRFHVDPGPHVWYVVEVAARPELFDSANHGAERTEANFYGSWADSPFQSGPSYLLPAGAWARLRLAEQLWYRIGASASATAYVDYVVSTPDDNGEQAPSIRILPGTGAPSPMSRTSRRSISDLLPRLRKSDLSPVIEGPMTWDRGFGPPTFRLDPGTGSAYAVDVAHDPDGFEGESEHLELLPGERFTSGWIRIQQNGTGDAPWTGSIAYVLPLTAWEELSGGAALYYRIRAQGEAVSASAVYVTTLSGETAAAVEKKETPVRKDEMSWRVQAWDT